MGTKFHHHSGAEGRLIGILKPPIKFGGSQTSNPPPCEYVQVQITQTHSQKIMTEITKHILYKHLARLLKEKRKYKK